MNCCEGEVLTDLTLRAVKGIINWVTVCLKLGVLSRGFGPCLYIIHTYRVQSYYYKRNGHFQQLLYIKILLI